MTAIIVQRSNEIEEFLRGKLKKRVFQYACNYDIDLNGNYALRKCLCCFHLLEREVDVGLKGNSLRDSWLIKRTSK